MYRKTLIALACGVISAPKPSPDFGLDRRPGYEKYGWGQNPQGPASTSDVIKKRLDCNHPTYRGGAIGWETCR